MIPSGHKAFLVRNVNDVELLLMHNRTFAAEYVILLIVSAESIEAVVPFRGKTSWHWKSERGVVKLTRNQDCPQRLVTKAH